MKFKKEDKRKEIKPSDVFTDIFVENLIFSVLEYIIYIITFAIVFAFPMLNFTVGISNGESMEPNVPHGSVEIIKTKRLNLKRGTIIVMKSTDSFYNKRIVGLPGETIKIKDNIVYINGNELKEDYEVSEGYIDIDDCEIGENEYYVLGDNRENSYDSRMFGTVNEELILGVSMFTFPAKALISKYNITSMHFSMVLLTVFLVFAMRYYMKKRVFYKRGYCNLNKVMYVSLDLNDEKISFYK